MVRLSKDAQPLPRRSLTRAANAVRRVTDGQPGQYPVYTCPWITVTHTEGDSVYTPCTRSWDRRLISTPELRMQVWDHVTGDHVPGSEAGLIRAGHITADIREVP